MENSNNNTTVDLINLSETEKQMIQLQREKEAIAKQEKELQLKAEIETDIKEEQKRMASFILEWQQQNAAARNYYNELRALDSNFQLVETPYTKDFGVVTEEGNTYTTCLSYRHYNSDKSVTTHWKEVVEYINIEIKHTTVDKTIVVKEHFTSTSSSKSHYSSRSVNNGFKMWLKYDNNRCTKDVKNMYSKFSDMLAQIARKNKETTEAETSKQQTLSILTTKYPEAKIEFKSEYIPSRYRHNNGYTENFYIVTFKNGYGIKFTYSFHKNTVEVHYAGTICPKNFDVDTYISAIQNIK